MKAVNQVYTYWESKEPLPAYLKLCMDTWYKNIPDLKVDIINHSNLSAYIGNDYDIEKLKTFSLPMQSDAVSASVLAKRGGMFIDADTIITKNIFDDFVNFAPNKFVGFGKPNSKGFHLAVIKSLDPNNPVAKKWSKIIAERIKNRPENISWAYLGNEPLGQVMNEKAFFEEYLIMDRSSYGNILEAAIFKEGNPQSDYFNLYFNDKVNVDEDYAISCAKSGLISLHNSWTPSWYRSIKDETEVLSQKLLISRILKRILSV